MPPSHVPSGLPALGVPESARRHGSRLRLLGKIVAVLIVYYVAGRIGLAVPFTSGNVSPVWPPAGVAVAAILLLGYQVWPGIALGAFLVNFFSSLPHTAALGLCIGNTLGPVVGVALFRRGEGDRRLLRLRDMLSLMTTAGLIGTAVSATLGVSVLYLTHVHAWSDLSSAWLMWWLGDGMGVLLVAPLLLTVSQLAIRPVRRRLSEFAGLLLLVAAGCLIMFGSGIDLTPREDLLAFAIFPLIIWAAIRFEVIGAAAAGCLIAALSVWQTGLGIGPFARHGYPLQNAGFLQAFLSVLSVSGLTLGAVMTEKRHAQQALQKQTERVLAIESQRLQLAQQAASIGTWEWNLRTGVITWSPELEAIHGFPPGGFDGTYESWLATVHPDDREWVEKAKMSAAQQDRPLDVEYRSIRPDGSIYWTAARGRVLLDENGRPERLVGIRMDINSRKLAEQALRNSEKLAATGRLAATVAHEINNPLEAITNLLYLIRSEVPSDTEGYRYLAMAEEELRRVSLIAKRTLGFYRESTSPVMVDLAQAVDEVLSIFQKRLDAKRIHLSRRYREVPPLQCNGGEMRQVFANMISNAIDATPADGKLHLGISRVRHPETGDLAGVRIFIADNGPGIQASHRDKVFEPFFTTKRDVGTGLGLWICQSIVQKHGGFIRLRSSVTPGRSGTAFSIFLPFTASQSAEKAIA